ncbi:MAG: hypothetical protein U9R15_13645 [Chloroflexota bacterium]|nr:hypothetical protein [Chloroflexota bacterium]
MKNVLSVFVLLVVYIVPAHPVSPHSQSPIGSLVVTNPAPEYALEMVGWAEWIWLPRRPRRPWRPLLPRKVRRRIQLQLRRIRKRQRRLILKRQRARGEQRSSRSRKLLLVLAGAAIAFLLLYLTVSVWLDAPRQFSLQPYAWGMPSCLAAIAGVAGSGQKTVVYGERQHYHPEFDHCLFCDEKLISHRHLNWRKPIQMLSGNVYVTSRGRYCSCQPKLTYLSAEAAHLSLPYSTYGLDVLVRVGYLRDYEQKTNAQIHADLPSHIRISERHVSNLYREYLALLACAEQLDVDKLLAAAAKYGGLVISVDALEPEGGQPQLWVVREVLTGTLLAAGWIPRVDKDTIATFLAPVEALNLPVLATVSDKQRSLINALEKIWSDVPHQYCQAHYLSNAVTPVYEKDGHMKTQLRKQVRAGAGATMREVQAHAKREAQASDDDASPRDVAYPRPPLIATGMAARPPEGLDEVRAVAEAVQRGEEVTLQKPDTQIDQPTGRPQTVDDVRKVLEGSNVIVYERRNPKNQALAEETTLSPPDRQARVDKLAADYAARLRRVLSRSGRKPFRLAGLRLYADLLNLLGSLEVSLSHLPDESRLTCFADAIRDGLRDFEDDYVWIAEGYTWVVDISAILDVPLPEPGAEAPKRPLSEEVHDRLNAYLDRLDRRTDLSAPLIEFREHLRALTERYAPGLFHCYDIPGLPRTDNDLESVFGRVRRQTLRTSGPHHAKQRLHEEGAWLLFDLVSNEHEQLERLQRVSMDEWREERQRIREHRATFTEDRRFRRTPSRYLAELEAQAEEIAKL